MESLLALSSSAFLAGLTAYLVILSHRELATVRLARASTILERNLLREQISELAERRQREQEKAERTWDGFRKFVVARKVREAADICSFYLEPHDRKALPAFSPGQYLTFRLNIPGQAKAVVRCYSLSDAPKPDRFRVTIKRIGPPPGKPDGRPGLVSCFFHDQIEEGDVVDVKAPSGQFYLDTTEQTPVILIGGGIGLTPVLSMLNALAEAKSEREVWFFYGVRHGGEHVMADYLRQVAADNPNIHLNVCYSDPRPDQDRPEVNYDHAERVSIELFKRTLPSKQGDYYLCGPPPMMQSLVDGLLAWGVEQTHIHYEAFGPASVKSTTRSQVETAATSNIEIAFSRSDKRCVWDGHSTLLEIAEANGVHIDSGCRAGNCGTCITAIKEGSVNYPTKPGTSIEAGSCLVCVAIPGSNIVLDG